MISLLSLKDFAVVSSAELAFAEGKRVDDALCRVAKERGAGGKVILADVTDAWPFRVPAVRAVVAVAGLGQAVGVPAALIQRHQNE